MFYNCISLKSIPNISSWDTSKVKNMKGMFYQCSSLTEISDISKWNVQKVNDFSFMFCGCKRLEKDKLTKFTEKIENINKNIKNEGEHEQLFLCPKNNTSDDSGQTL